MMQNRLCIPLHNTQGELVAYLGRWVGPDATIPENEGKYKLPLGFQKEHVLYNLRYVARFRHVIVVEGFFGVFRLHQLRIPAVALMGLHLSEHHLELLRQLEVERLTFLLDGDAAGRSAVPEMMALLSRSPIRAKFAVLPDGTQPDTVDEAELLDILALRR